MIHKQQNVHNTPEIGALNDKSYASSAFCSHNVLFDAHQINSENTVEIISEKFHRKLRRHILKSWGNRNKLFY